MTWATGTQACTLDVDFRSYRSHVGLTDPRGLRETFDL
jgi:hypothetical protein